MFAGRLQVYRSTAKCLQMRSTDPYTCSIQLVYTGIQVYRSTGLQVYSLRIPQVYSQEAVYGIQSTVYTEYTGGIQLLSWYQVYSGIQVYSHPSGVHLVPRLARREGGAGHGRCPVEVGGGDPQDPLRVPAGRDNEEEQGGARALLPEDLPPVLGTPGPGEGGGQVRASPAAGRVRGRCEGRAPGELPGERLAHDSVRGGLAWCRCTPGWSCGGGWAPRPRLPRIP